MNQTKPQAPRVLFRKEPSRSSAEDPVPDDRILAKTWPAQNAMNAPSKPGITDRARREMKEFLRRVGAVCKGAGK